MTVNIRALREQHPAGFDAEYQKWAQYACADYDWWESVYDDFMAKMAEQGLTMHSDKRGPRIYFSLGYCQSDYASFAGTLDFAKWLRANGYELTHLPLVLDVEEFGARVTVRGSDRTATDVYIDYEPGNVAPVGIFAGLPQDEWDMLVAQHYESVDWVEVIRDWADDQEAQLYTALREEYEYLTSEEQFVEWAESNDELFDVEDEDETAAQD